MLKQLQSKNSMTFILLLYHYFTFLSRILIAYIYPSTGGEEDGYEEDSKSRFQVWEEDRFQQETPEEQFLGHRADQGEQDSTQIERNWYEE